MLAANSVTQPSSNVFLKHRNISYIQIKYILTVTSRCHFYIHIFHRKVCATELQLYLLILRYHLAYEIQTAGRCLWTR